MCIIVEIFLCDTITFYFHFISMYFFTIITIFYYLFFFFFRQTKQNLYLNTTTILPIAQMVQFPSIICFDEINKKSLPLFYF